MSWSRLHPRQLWKIFLARWRHIILAMLATSVIAGVASTKYNPPYQASAKILVQENNTVNPFLSDMMVDWSIKNRLPVITNVILSRQTAETVLRQLGRLDDKSSEAKIEDEIRRFQRQLSIYGLGAGIVHVKYTGSSPVEVYEGIRLLIDIFIAEMLRPQKEALDESVSFLDMQVTRVRAELKADEDKMRQFKEEHAEELPDVYKANLQAYMIATQSKAEASAELASKRQDLSITKERLSRFDPVTQDLEAKLVQARQRYEQLKSTYQADHPEVLFARGQWQRLEAQRKTMERSRRPSEVRDLESIALGNSQRQQAQGADLPLDLLTDDLLRYREAQNEVGSLEQRAKMFDEQTKRAMTKVRSYAKHEQRLNELTRDIEIKNKVYQSLLKRHEDALVTRALTLRDEASRVWVIERPVMPMSNRAIPWFLAALAGLIVGAVIGAGVLVLLEALDPTVRVPEHLEPLGQVPCLGVLPAMDEARI